MHITDETAVVMKQAYDMGCEIENHSQNHLHMDKISKEEILDEIKKTDDLIEKYIGKKPTYFRPPFIDVNDLMHEIIDHTFICGHCPNDWDPNVNSQETAKGVIETNPSLTYIKLESGFNVSDEDVCVAIALKKGDSELNEAVSGVLSKITEAERNALMDEAIAKNAE